MNWRTWRCEVCPYQWRGPRWEHGSVVHRHELKHEIVAEAMALLAGGSLPRPIEEREVGCSCPVDVYDPDCVVHSLEANW